MFHVIRSAIYCTHAAEPEAVCHYQYYLFHLSYTPPPQFPKLHA